MCARGTEIWPMAKLGRCLPLYILASSFIWLLFFLFSELRPEFETGFLLVEPSMTSSTHFNFVYSFGDAGAVAQFIDSVELNALKLHFSPGHLHRQHYPFRPLDCPQRSEISARARDGSFNLDI